MRLKPLGLGVIAAMGLSACGGQPVTVVVTATFTPAPPPTTTERVVTVVVVATPTTARATSTLAPIATAAPTSSAGLNLGEAPVATALPKPTATKPPPTKTPIPPTKTPVPPSDPVGLSLDEAPNGDPDGGLPVVAILSNVFNKNGSNQVGFRAFARAKGAQPNQDGEGIQRVRFTVESQDGDSVYEHTENTHPYCMFQESSGTNCRVLKVGDNWWQTNTKITPGTYKMFVRVDGKKNERWNGEITFKLK